jgi:hypothetical protein
MSVKLQRGESCDGGYVPYSEYAALKAERDELIEALIDTTIQGCFRTESGALHHQCLGVYKYVFQLLVRLGKYKWEEEGWSIVEKES